MTSITPQKSTGEIHKVNFSRGGTHLGLKTNIAEAFYDHIIPTRLSAFYGDQYHFLGEM